MIPSQTMPGIVKRAQTEICFKSQNADKEKPEFKMLCYRQLDMKSGCCMFAFTT